MPLIDRLESRLGRFAIPGILQAIAILQLFTLGIFMFLSPEARQPYVEFLALKPDLLMQGQVWRLFTYNFIPNTNLFFALIGAMFMMWIGRGLDEAWGAFKVNLYVIGGMIFQAIGAVIFGYEGTTTWLYLASLFAFATIFPNEEILLFFILPVKIKWVAFFTAAMLAISVISAPIQIILIFFGLLNYGIAFGPDFVRSRLHSAKTANRRARFEEAQSGAAFFHQCKVCGKTDVDDRTLNFRVTDDGDEICSSCRKLG
ncbi:hypothetical protein EI77_03298 [Prosthecobacter fusiformis]|uniref:Membrane associated rhomboid family serine protease n=1 Tax=Prosthecobacter fusiformis TaxID=48464 RepID=A0A4R7RRJ6_9BACT|nr:hypothetical protein [Prosthecobacter fusiformis]TDU68181.1 hypothetical protein EI77_03298 [Prosthecobacter fusiformis]